MTVACRAENKLACSLLTENQDTSRGFRAVWNAPMFVDIPVLLVNPIPRTDRTLYPIGSMIQKERFVLIAFQFEERLENWIIGMFSSIHSFWEIHPDIPVRAYCVKWFDLLFEPQTHE